MYGESLVKLKQASALDKDTPLDALAVERYGIQWRGGHPRGVTGRSSERFLGRFPVL